MVDFGEEPPVVEVIDSVLKDGIGCPVTPKVSMEPCGEGLHQLVRGVIGRCVQFNDSRLLLSFSSTM